MQKPRSIKMIQLFLYVDMGMFLLSFAVSLGSGNITATQLPATALLVLLSLACGYFAQRFIKNRKFGLAVSLSALTAFLILIMTPNQIAFMLGFLVLMLFFFRPTRAYFKGEYVAPSRPATTGEVTNQQVVNVSPEEEVKTLPQGDSTAPVSAPAKPKHVPVVEIREATEDDADTIHSLMLAAFEEYRAAVPPSSALDETVESVRESLAEGNEQAAIVYEDDKPAAMVRYRFEGDDIYFFRLSVLPEKRRRGYAKKLIAWIEHRGISVGKNTSRCKVRQSVKNNLTLYQDRGYEVVDQELVVRPGGSIKTLTMQKRLGPN